MPTIMVLLIPYGLNMLAKSTEQTLLSRLNSLRLCCNLLNHSEIILTIPQETQNLDQSRPISCLDQLDLSTPCHWPPTFAVWNPQSPFKQRKGLICVVLGGHQIVHIEAFNHFQDLQILGLWPWVSRCGVWALHSKEKGMCSTQTRCEKNSTQQSCFRGPARCSTTKTEENPCLPYPLQR